MPILSLSIHKCPDPEDNPVSVFLNLTLGWILIFRKIYTNHMAKDRQTVWSMNLESWTRAAAQTPHFSQNAPIIPVVWAFKFPAGGKALMLIESMLYIWSILILKSLFHTFSSPPVSGKKYPPPCQGQPFCALNFTSTSPFHLSYKNAPQAVFSFKVCFSTKSHLPQASLSPLYVPFYQLSHR